MTQALYLPVLRLCLNTGKPRTVNLIFLAVTSLALAATSMLRHGDSVEMWHVQRRPFIERGINWLPI